MLFWHSQKVIYIYLESVMTLQIALGLYTQETPHLNHITLFQID